MNPVAPIAQKKVRVPEGLDLDAWINDPPDESIWNSMYEGRCTVAVFCQNGSGNGIAIGDFNDDLSVWNFGDSKSDISDGDVYRQVCFLLC